MGFAATSHVASRLPGHPPGFPGPAGCGLIFSINNRDQDEDEGKDKDRDKYSTTIKINVITHIKIAINTQISITIHIPVDRIVNMNNKKQHILIAIRRRIMYDSTR